MLQTGVQSSALDPPRLRSCAIRVVLRVWMSSNVKQCVLKCGHGFDNIDHYAVCPMYHNRCRRYLKLVPLAPNLRADVFTLVQDSVCGPEVTDDIQRQANLLRAVSVYALYKVELASCHGQGPFSDPTGAWRGALRTASEGAPRLAALLDGIHKRRSA